MRPWKEVMMVDEIEKVGSGVFNAEGRVGRSSERLQIRKS